MQQGFFSVQQTCPIVEGRGKSSRILKTCHGSGVQENEDAFSQVPPGVDTGDRIRLSGEGESGCRWTNGDLYVQVVVKEHPILCDGSNLYCDVPVAFTDVALGG